MGNLGLSAVSSQHSTIVIFSLKKKTAFLENSGDLPKIQNPEPGEKQLGKGKKKGSGSLELRKDLAGK